MGGFLFTINFLTVEFESYLELIKIICISKLRMLALQFRINLT